jgi:hypothetical protein
VLLFLFAFLCTFTCSRKKKKKKKKSEVARQMLSVMIEVVCGKSSVSDLLESRFKHVWADHADMISLRYTGVGALKTDFTRSGKRSGIGMAQDAIKSVKRLAQVCVFVEEVRIESEKEKQKSASLLRCRQAGFY